MHEQYHLDHTVIYSETDLRGYLSLPAFFSIFQEAALLHAEDLGFGESYCSEAEKMWVLSRLLVKIESFPTHRTKLNLRTWPRQPKGPIALREFILEGDDGKMYAKVTSSWLILDTKTMRPSRPHELFSSLNTEPLGTALEEDAPKLPKSCEGDCKRKLEVKARYSDIDQNQHVNNTRYIRWFLDCYDPEEIVSKRSFNFAINYLKAAEYGDTLKLERYDVEESSFVLGLHEDGTIAFSAKVWFD